MWTTLVAILVAAVPATAGGAASARAWQDWKPPAKNYGYALSKSFVTMSDGQQLEATMAYPTTNTGDTGAGTRAPGRFPVIIEHTPYPYPIVTDWTPYGYISLQVRARGTGLSLSTGTFDFLGPGSRRDGVQIIKYAATMAGSNGVVGQWGCSWVGSMTMIDAASVGPHSPLKAIWPMCTGFDSSSREVFFSDGIVTPSVAAMPGIGGITGGQPNTEAYFTKFFANIIAGGDKAYYGPYWARYGGAGIQDMKRIVDNGIPAMLDVGWQDVTEAQGLAAYVALQNAAAHRDLKAPMSSRQRANQRYQIIVGDWGHGGGQDNMRMLEWWETWLKGKDTGMQRVTDTLHLYETGAQPRWVDTSVYPQVSHYTSLYLGADGSLQAGRTAPGQRSLPWQRPDQPGGTLTFDTSPMKRGATLAGPVSATVYASSSNSNLELIGSLYDVATDGTSTLITTGTVLGSQRELSKSKSWYDENGIIVHPYLTQTHEDYLDPGHVYKLEIALSPRQWSVAPGHALRFTLTSQAALSCSAALLATDPCYYTAPQLMTLPGGTYNVRLGGATPASVHLPLLPYRHFRTTKAPVDISNVCAVQLCVSQVP